MKYKLVFLSIFIFLAIYVSNLRLFVDDYVFLYHPPRLTENYFTFLQSYTQEFGIYRPLATIYYYFIYSLYLTSPSLAHLIPWALQVVCGYILFKILKNQGLPLLSSLLSALIFTLHPLATEQYMWFGANQGTIANLIFLSQIFLIQKLTSFPKTIIITTLLSLASVLTYESSFFFFLPLSFLIFTKFKQPLTKILPPQLIPILTYVATKIAIIPTNPRPLVDNLSSLTHNITHMVNNLINVHFGNYYLEHFWTNYRNLALIDLFSSSASLIIFVYVISFIIFTIVTSAKNQTHPTTTNGLIFWLLTFLASLPPLIANKEFYFGFRSLFLPSISLLILLFWIFHQILGKNMLRLVYLFSFIFIFNSFLINVTIATKYRQLYDQDIYLSTHPDQISSFPLDSRNTFLHADHLLSCFFYDWCAKAITNHD